jgi:hypothetical protein
LVLESELNRLLLAAEWHELKTSFRHATDVTHAVRQARNLLPLLAPVAGFLTGRRRRKGASAASGWFGKAAKGVKVAAPAVLAWRKVRQRRASSGT